MANKYASLKDLFTGIANSIREKTGNSESIVADDFPEIISTIETGADTSGVTATAADVLSPKVFVDSSGKEVTGTIPSQAAKIITPNDSSQTAVAAGRYTAGTVTVAAIPSSYVQMNFTVVGGTSQPSSPAENTIWVNTDATITSYVFSAIQPTGSEGMVWIETGTSGEASFNALKNDSIYIFPKRAKQYIGGTWVRKEAFIYNGNAWVEWINYFFKQGEQYIAITGGWGTDYGSISGNYMYVHSPGSGTYNSWCYTKNKIDLSQINTIYARCSSLTGSNGPLFLICNTKNPYDGFVVRGFMNSLEYSIDTSDLTGSYYIVFAGNTGGGGGYITDVYY